MHALKPTRDPHTHSRGRKKWVFYPPHCPPPGVMVSADGYNVATPPSLNEWFSNFYKLTKDSSVR